MKKLSILASLLLGLIVFTACDSDRDDNPTLLTPTTFTMNTPVIGDNTVDLQTSTSVELKASQPDYGFPTAVIYGAQISINGNWTDSASVYTLDQTASTPTINASSTEIDKGLMILGGFTDQSMLNTDSVYKVKIRMTAALKNDSTNLVYSNEKTINVYPYYMELKSADPVFWYMIGAGIGDGTWTNTASWDTYKAIFPMSLEKEYSYDKKTGLGEIQSTVYLTTDVSTSGFKLILTPSSWNSQWGMNSGVFAKNDGGSGNIAVTEEGYYTLTYNTSKDVVSIAKAANQSPTVFTTVSIIGLNGDWNTDVDMTPALNQGTHNHMWTAQLTVTSTTAFKFRANHAWDTNWGYGSADGDINLYGITSSGGHNIGIAPGKYTVYLNDLDGFFRIVPFT